MHSSTLPDTSIHVGRFHPLVAGLVRLVRALRGRTATAELAELDDRLLSDLGLARADIATALHCPLTQDPSFGLALVSAKRAHAALQPHARLADGVWRC